MFKKLFKKKQKGKKNEQDEEVFNSDNFLMLNTSSLQTMTSEELVNLIFRYDLELKNSYKLINEKSNLEVEYNKVINEIQALQEQNTVLYTENESFKKSLEQKSVQLSSLNTELATQNSTQEKQLIKIENLNHQLSEMRRVMEEEANRSPSSGSPEKQAEIIALKAKTLEMPKMEEQIRDFQIRLKILDTDKSSLEFQVKTLKTQLLDSQDSLKASEKQKQELELSSLRNQLEFNADKRDFEQLMQQRNTYETETLTLKDIIMKKDRKLEKKYRAMSSLDNDNAALRSENTSLKQQKAIAESTHELELTKAKEQNACDLKFKEEMSNANVKSLQRDLDEKTEQILTLKQQITDLKSDLSMQNTPKVSVTEYETQLAATQARILVLETQIEKDKQKQDGLKQKLRELTVQLNSARAKPSAGFSIKSGEMAEPEFKVLTQVKGEFEILYKNLMKIMMTSETVSNTRQQMWYVMDCGEFSEFERRLNNVIMAVNEVVEGHYVPSATSQSEQSPKKPNKKSSSLTNVSPLRFFSWLISPKDKKIESSMMDGIRSNTGGNARPPRPVIKPRKGSVEQPRNLKNYANLR